MYSKTDYEVFAMNIEKDIKSLYEKKNRDSLVNFIDKRIRKHANLRVYKIHNLNQLIKKSFEKKYAGTIKALARIITCYYLSENDNDYLFNTMGAHIYRMVSEIYKENDYERLLKDDKENSNENV